MNEAAIAIPAIVGKQGDRTFYQLMVKNKTLTSFFAVNLEPESEKSQRALDPSHAAKITKYIVSNPQDYVLGTMTFAVDSECRFEASNIADNIGLLHIPLDSTVRSLDGQHRRHALKDAINQLESVSTDNSAMLLYVEPDVHKRRQMFSDMNSTPKVVSKAVNVRFNSRDPYSRAANRIIDEHPLLEGIVETERASVTAKSDKVWTLGGIFDALKRLHPEYTKSSAKMAGAEENIFNRAQVLFDILGSARLELAEASHGTLDLQVARTENILFSSVTLRAIAGALGEIYKVNGGVLSDDQIEDITDRLSEVDFSPSNPAWSDCGFLAPGTSTPSSRLQEIKAGTQVLVKLLS